MKFFSNSNIIEHFFKPQLEDLFSYTEDVQVEMWRMDLSRLENKNKYFCRVGIYSGGNNPDGSIPGMDRNRPLRVDAGVSLDTVQQYKIDVSWVAGTVNDDGEFVENLIEDVSDLVAGWIRSISNTVYNLTGGLIPLITYGGISQPTRVRKYATATITIYSLRKLLTIEEMTPDAPGNFSYVDVDGFVDFEWDPVEYVNGYNVYLNKDGAGFEKVNEFGIINAPLTDYGLALDPGSYEAYVTAQVVGQESDPSNEVSFIIA